MIRKVCDLHYLCVPYPVPHCKRPLSSYNRGGDDLRQMGSSIFSELAFNKFFLPKNIWPPLTWSASRKWTCVWPEWSVNLSLPAQRSLDLDRAWHTCVVFTAEHSQHPAWCWIIVHLLAAGVSAGTHTLSLMEKLSCYWGLWGHRKPRATQDSRWWVLGR